MLCRGYSRTRSEALVPVVKRYTPLRAALGKSYARLGIITGSAKYNPRWNLDRKERGDTCFSGA